MYIVQRPPWWLHPALLPVFFTLPIFLAASAVSSETLILNRVPANYVDTNVVITGTVALLATSVGAAIPTFVFRAPSFKEEFIRFDRIYLALRVLGVVALACTLTMLGSLVTKFDLVLAAFRGEAGPSFLLKEALGRIPGITSFVQLKLLFFSLLMACRLDPEFKLPKDIRWLSISLAFLTVAYAMLASERLAAIEILIIIAVTPAAFMFKPSTFRTFAPLVGICIIFFTFAAGEYFRSWPFYRGMGYTFIEFSVNRFVGYFSTSINNGAMFLKYGEPAGQPLFTAVWFYKFPLWPVIDYIPSNPDQIARNYLSRYANIEFNNLGGIFIPLMDFGPVTGVFIWCLLGFVGGTVFRLFAARTLFGLLFFPVWYIGFADVIRIFYWGDPRVFPVYITVLPLWYYLVSDRRVRSIGA